jgi:transcriptional repressor NrdR
MKCPYCAHLEDRVLDSRAVREGAEIKRRRECLECQRRFTTYETIEDMAIMVVKKDGRREAFNRHKVLEGLQAACRKRPVSSETIERISESIERQIYDRGEREIASQVIGELVMQALRQVDQVAYVRYASVYRDFQDATQFQEIVAMLREESRPKRRARRVPNTRA